MKVIPFEKIDSLLKENQEKIAKTFNVELVEVLQYPSQRDLSTHLSIKIIEGLYCELQPLREYLKVITGGPVELYINGLKAK